MSNDKSLTVSKIIKADKATVFNALTDEKIMAKWFCAGPEGWSSTVKSDSKKGGSYQIDMHDGEDVTYTHTGEYKEVTPNDKIVFSWNSQVVEDTLVTITLTAVNDGTEVKLHHEFMPNDQQVENHTGGWTMILERLSAVV
ncbi:MAG: SRPBCC domain-containing protein [Balneola sp.]